MLVDYDFLDPNRPVLTMCACGGQPQCFHDEDTAFGVYCTACFRQIANYEKTIDAINAWNALMAKERDNSNA